MRNLHQLPRRQRLGAIPLRPQGQGSKLTRCTYSQVSASRSRRSPDRRTCLIEPVRVSSQNFSFVRSLRLVQGQHDSSAISLHERKTPEHELVEFFHRPLPAPEEFLQPGEEQESRLLRIQKATFDGLQLAFEELPFVLGDVTLEGGGFWDEPGSESRLTQRVEDGNGNRFVKDAHSPGFKNSDAFRDRLLDLDVVKDVHPDDHVEELVGIIERFGGADRKICASLVVVCPRQLFRAINIARRDVEAVDQVSDLRILHCVVALATAEIEQALIARFKIPYGQLGGVPVRILGALLLAEHRLEWDMVYWAVLRVSFIVLALSLLPVCQSN